MKRLLFYLWLEIKKGMKFIPFFLAGILFTAAAVILAAAAFSAANGGEQVLPKATAAIVIDSDGSDETRTEAGQADLKTNLALGLVSGMPSVKSVCEFVFMSPKEAADGLQEGTVDAAVYLPQNVYEDINTGINTPVLIRVSGKYTSFTGGMFEELVRSGVSYIRSVEGSIYAVDSLSRSYPVVDTLAAAEDTLFNIYIQKVLARGETFMGNSISAFGDLTMPQFYGAAAALLILLIFGVGASKLYDSSERSMTRALKRKGLHPAATSFMKYLALTATLFFLSLLIALVGDVIGAAAASFMESAAAEEAVSVTACLKAGLGAVPLFFRNIGARLLPALFLALPLAALMHLLYTFLPLRRAAASYLIIAAALFIVGGGLIPKAFLPELMQGITGFLPTSVLERQSAALLFGTRGGQILPAVLIPLIPALIGGAAYA